MFFIKAIFSYSRGIAICVRILESSIRIEGKGFPSRAFISLRMRTFGIGNFLGL